MYGRIGGSVAEAVAGLERGGSSSAGASPYSLRSNPPIIKIVDRESFMRKVRQSCPVTSCSAIFQLSGRVTKL